MLVVRSRTFVLAALCLLAAPAAAQTTMSAKDAFEKFGLLGTFAGDCSQPVSARNGYIVYRAVDAQRVQRDTMVSSPCSQARGKGGDPIH